MRRRTAKPITRRFGAGVRKGARIDQQSLAPGCQLQRKGIRMSVTAVVHPVRPAVKQQVVRSRRPAIAHYVVPTRGKRFGLRGRFVRINAIELGQTFRPQKPERFLGSLTSGVFVIAALKPGSSRPQRRAKIINRALIQHHQAAAIIVPKQRRCTIRPGDIHQVVEQQL